MALHVPKAPGFSQMLKDGAMVSAIEITNKFIQTMFGYFMI